MSKITVAEFARRIQRLTSIQNPTTEEENELKFYSEVLKKMVEIDVENLVPIDITCTLSDAQKWALPLGMHVVNGQSGIIYLSWSKGLND